MPPTHPYQVAVYYFPNYHPDPRNAAVHGPGWDEWTLVQQAHPRFPGHRQPRVPLWGYEDESDPTVMAKKIAAAADHAVSAFIFDWYWYNDGPFLERGLEKGFLGAPNNERLKFAVMWANHNWTDIHPARYRECSENDFRVLYPGAVTRETFETAAKYLIERYFSHPSYWKIAGAPYFSLYDLPEMVRGLGGVDALRDALGWFRAQTQSAGFPDLHLNQVYWSQGILPGEKAVLDPDAMLRWLGFDSITSYVWVHHAALTSFPVTDYQQAARDYLSFYERTLREIHLPYYPNASVGWDSSPRTVQSDTFAPAGYPFLPVLGGSSPAAFRTALQEVKARMDAAGARIITVNSWNEWTEGSYLEPDTKDGLGYLEAIRAVFGT